MNHRIRRRQVFETFASLAVILLLAMPQLALGQGPSALYWTKFEEPDFVADVPLVFQDGWVGIPPLSPLAAVVSTGKPHQGKQSVHVWGGDLVSGTFAPYAAIGSYRRPLNHIVSPEKPIVVLEANLLLESDQPATTGIPPADDFFSMTIAARSGAGETLGEMGLSSSGAAVAYGFNASPGAVPAFKAPIVFNEWYRVRIVMDFSDATTVVSYYLDGELIGATPTTSVSKVLLRGALVVYALPDGDDARADYTARFDNFRVSVHGADDDGD